MAGRLVMSRSGMVLFSVLMALKCLGQESSTTRSDVTPDAQTSVPHTLRPRIGVALEGGGALGFAHIGVLRWFEEHHIPIDYIAGTSMGGLVGGLYATGKTPQQMEEFVRAQEWDEVLVGDTPYD